MSRSGSGFSPLNGVATVRNFVDVMREVSFDSERQQAERQPHMLILAPDETLARQVSDELTGSVESPSLVLGNLDGGSRDVDGYDVVVVYDPASGQSFDRIRRRSGRGGLHVFDVASIDTSGWADELRNRVCRAIPDLAPALGRWFRPFRPAAARAVIDETSRVNAQFALVSNAPAVIPVFGSLAAAGADFFVITKNQIMLIFKLAAIHGRDLRNQWGLMREMAPVVGTGLAWRTVAREASAFIPLAAGTIPKVAIAWTGTMAAGWAADAYYQFGERPTKEQWSSYYKTAMKAPPAFTLPLRRDAGRKDAANGNDIIETTLSAP